jgi:UDP-glucose 4-epimerase
MKILVTGATGFIGSFIVSELLKRGDDVLVFDIKPAPESTTEHQNKEIIWSEGDIRDYDQVWDSVSTHKPEVIINMAGLLQFGCMEDPRMAIEVNVVGFSNILEAARTNQVRRVVTASSAAVYGGRQEPPLETSMISPGVTLYGGTKFLNEILSRQYKEKYGLEVTNLRYYGVYGPGEVKSPGMAKVIKDIESIVTGKDVVVDVIQATDRTHLIYVTDAAHATVLAATVPGPLSLTYSIAGVPADFVTFGEMVACLKKIHPESGRVVFKGKGPPRGWYTDSMLAEKELGFKPRYTMESGLRETTKHLIK